MASSSSDTAPQVSLLAYSTSSEMTCKDVFALCGFQHFINTHHEERNSHPLNMDKKGILLSPFEGPNYKEILNSRFQEGIPVLPNMPEPSTENKAQGLDNEMMFWEHFSYAAAPLNRTSIFDIGVCGSAAIVDEGDPSWRPYSCSVLDAVCLTIESRGTFEMRQALDMGSVTPSMKSFQDAFYGEGQPSPFLMQKCANACSRYVVAGCKGYVSRCQRLVLKDEVVGWLSDVHASYDFRRIVLCNHILGTVGKFDDSCPKVRDVLSEFIFEFKPEFQEVIGAHVMYHLNQVSRILRGVDCPIRLGIHQPNVHESVPFTEVRSRWMAIRELIAIGMRRCYSRVENAPEMSALELFNKLSCGIDLIQAFCMASWSNKNASGIDVPRLVKAIRENTFELEDFINDARNLESVELVVWVDMMLKFRVLCRVDENGGMFGVEVNDLYICKHHDAEEEAFCTESDDFDNLDEIFMAATGVKSLEQLEPLLLKTDYKVGDRLAASFGEKLKRKRASVKNNVETIRGGESWMVDSVVHEEVDLFDSKTDARMKFRLLESGDVVSFKPGVARKVGKAIAKMFKGAGVCMVSVSVDLTPLVKAGAANSFNTMNDLMGGRYGVEGVRYGLSLMFAGKVKVKTGCGTPTSYVPKVAHSENGIVLNRFLPVHVMSQATYFERNGKVFWVPQEGMNVFEVTPLPKAGTTHFEEIEEAVLVEEEVGLYDIKFKVGQ